MPCGAHPVNIWTEMLGNDVVDMMPRMARMADAVERCIEEPCNTGTRIGSKDFGLSVVQQRICAGKSSNTEMPIADCAATEYKVPTVNRSTGEG
jgi:hypothetical protein